jgi:hypothetical protein
MKKLCGEEECNPKQCPDEPHKCDYAIEQMLEYADYLYDQKKEREHDTIRNNSKIS